MTHELANRSFQELEDLYLRSPCGALPTTGVWRGGYLQEFSMPLGKRLIARAMFRVPTFGLDFDERCWWFGAPRLRAGCFDARSGRSRWRETDTIQLDYQRRGPRWIRGLLYDELKPLSPTCILGLGGENRDGAAGTMFYFSLVPLAR